jgi:predicted permease
MSRRPTRNRLFRWLLRLFPFEFRGDFGREMAADFADQRAAASAAGRRAETGLWARTLADMLKRAPAEHLDVLRRDVGYACRLLRRRPAFTVAAVLTLTAGIGMTTAVFSVVYAVLIRELPFRESHRLVRLHDVNTSGSEPARVTPGNFADWTREAKTLDGLALATFWPGRLQGPAGEPEQTSAMTVSEGYFELLGVRPEQGRLFTADEYRPLMPSGSGRLYPSVAVISRQLWQRVLEGAGGGVGSTIQFGGQTLVVVGIMPETLNLQGLADWREPPSLWVPGTPDVRARRARLAEAIGRLAPGVAIADAQREFDAISERLASAYPAANREWRVRVAVPLETATNSVRRQIWLLAAAAFCILVIACANVANLLLANSSARRAELATRIAIGASRGQLIRQLLTESVVLSFAGCGGGVLLALGAVRAIKSLAPANVPRLAEIVVDVRVLAFAIALAVAVGIACGLVASMSSRSLREDTSSRSGGVDVAGRGRRFREALTVVQVALALLLVVASGLLVRTVYALGRVELGFDPRQTISVQLNADFRQFGSVAAVARFQSDLLEQVKRLPGVVAAGVGARAMGGGTGMGFSTTPGVEGDSTNVNPVSSGYLRALNMRMIRGRFFDESDGANGVPVAIVSESAARKFWPGADPIGKVLYAFDGPLAVIGVVADVRKGSLESEYTPVVYLPQLQAQAVLQDTLAIRTTGDPHAIVPAVRSILKRLDPGQPITNVQTLQDILDTAMAPKRFMFRLVGLFSIVALCLAALGIYGVLAESVTQRVPEIGVRVALGATRTSIVSMVLANGAWMTGIGLALGTAGALATRQVMATQIFGVDVNDPSTYVSACVVMTLALLAACWLPARRAATVDPVIALRQE